MCMLICIISMSTFFSESNPLTYSYIIWFLGSKTTEDESTEAHISVQESENGNMTNIS